MIRSLKISLLCLISLAVLAAPVAANGKPVKIFLNYLPDVSNYGPAGASGVARVSIGEAWVELAATGLPQLSGELYEAWLIDASNGEMVSLGRFNADADGQVAYYAELDDLPHSDYRYFVITVEPDPDPSPEADPRRTIAGVFPNPQLQIVTGAPTAVPTAAAADVAAGDAPVEPAATATPPPPVTLPVTGEEPSGKWVLAGTALALAVGLAVMSLILENVSPVGRAAHRPVARDFRKDGRR